jgi:phosphoribosyl 1,2-cyclic phosphodiesterase
MSFNYCSLASGSSGNCHFIATDTTKILLDVGMSHRYIKKSLESIGESIDQIDGIFITHEHSDHIKGLPMVLKKQEIPVYMTEKTFEKVKSKIREEDLEKVILTHAEISRGIGDIQIESFPISHDAVDPKGYIFLNAHQKLGIVTDVGVMTDAILDKLIDTNFLVLEANHDVNMVLHGAYPYYLKQRILSDYGHLSNENAARTIERVFESGRLKNVVLAHLSKENNIPELAHLTVQRFLEEKGIDTDREINLDLSYRDRIGKFYRIV